MRRLNRLFRTGVIICLQLMLFPALAENPSGSEVTEELPLLFEYRVLHQGVAANTLWSDLSLYHQFNRVACQCREPDRTHPCVYKNRKAGQCLVFP